MENHNNWEQNQDVIAYLNSNNPTINMTARAYYARDIGMNRNLNDIATDAMRHLGYSANGINIFVNFVFRQRMDELMDRFLENPEEDPYEGLPIPELYDDFIGELENELQERRDRYDLLMNYIFTNDLLGFYMNMTLDELDILGF